MKTKLFVFILLSISILDLGCKGLTETEEQFVGTWRLTEYESNQQIPEAERANYDQNIQTLKSNFSLVLFDDKTFQRTGFAPQVETGEWFINTEGTILQFKSGDDKSGTVFVESISDEKMILVIDDTEVKVRLTLSRSKF